MNKTNDIFSLLKKDHRTVKTLFSQIDQTSERAAKKREKLYAQLREELTRHAHGEEVAIYPRLKANSETEDIGWESVEEHGVVKYLLARINEASADEPDWTALVTVLKESVEHHVKEEESEMFSKMKRAFSKEELDEISEEFLLAKEDTDLKIDGAPLLPRIGKGRLTSVEAAA